jgi:hypothetical protein
MSRRHFQIRKPFICIGAVVVLAGCGSAVKTAFISNLPQAHAAAAKLSTVGGTLPYIFPNGQHEGINTNPYFHFLVGGATSVSVINLRGYGQYMSEAANGPMHLLFHYNGPIVLTHIKGTSWQKVLIGGPETVVGKIIDSEATDMTVHACNAHGCVNHTFSFFIT